MLVKQFGVIKLAVFDLRRSSLFSFTGRTKT